MGRGVVLKLLLGLVLLMGGIAACVATHDQPAAVNQPNASAISAQMNQAYSDQGEKTCLTCHNSHPVDYVLRTSHAVKGDARSPFGQQGCESCHGPSGDHAKLKMGADGKLIMPPVLFKKPNVDGVDISPVAVRNDACLNCHQAGLRMNWQGSQHANNDLACTDCHTVPVTKDPVLVKVTQPGKCFPCHAQQRAESFEYSHHPIQEGLVVCSDCHNPHGSPGPHLMKEFTVNETCYNCHAEKRGPLLWEHQPVRDDCTNCHTPHGSVQKRLLIEQTPFLCDSCHSQSQASHGGAFGGAASIPTSQLGSTFVQSQLANQRSCLNCHSQIHGSNSPAGAFFLR